jgi:glycosyltransferase involved in cell wall biosynthesis
MRRAREFSVIIPTHNRLEFLQEALSSVWAQSHSDYEIIVVDDGSTDGTKGYLETLGGRVKALCQPNRGPSAARNFGVSHAAGSYITFLDNDDLWLPWTLATYHELIMRYEPSILRAGVIEFRGEAPIIRQGPLLAEWFCDYFDTARRALPLSSNMLAIKKTAFTQVGGFDESLRVAEDHDFCLRAGTIPGFVSIKSPITLAYRRTAGSLSTSEKAAFAAATEILVREFAGRYAGGKVKETNRRCLVSRMLRYVAISCLNAGLRREARSIYWRSFWMNFRLGRFRFLSGFLLYDAVILITGRAWRTGPVVHRSLGSSQSNG